MLTALVTSLNCHDKPLAGTIILICIWLPWGWINVSQFLPFALANHQVSNALEQNVTGPLPPPASGEQGPPEKSLRVEVLLCGLAQKDSLGSGEDSKEVIWSVPLPLWGSLSLPDLGPLDPGRLLVSVVLPLMVSGV